MSPPVARRERWASTSHAAAGPLDGGLDDGPLHRCTSPGTRETTLRRPVSWLAVWTVMVRVLRLLAPEGGNGIVKDLTAYSCEGSRGLAKG